MRARVAAVVFSILAAAGIGVAAWAFGGLHPARPAASGPCPPDRSLGSVAYLQGRELHVVDLRTCRDHVVARDASPPVRWSPDGSWIAFGAARVVPADGGAVRRPLGDRATRWAWTWSPSGTGIASVTPDGGVVVGGPGTGMRTLVRDGWGAGHLLFDPNGRKLAVDRLLVPSSASGSSGPAFRHEEVWTIGISNGARHMLYRTPSGHVAPPEVAGWSPDGRSVLFWPDLDASASIAADGLPLEAVPAGGGPAVRVAKNMLPFPDFLGACGENLLIGAGSDRYVTHSKSVVMASSPGRPARRVAGTSRASWFWPACSPDGSRIAATVTKNGEEPRFGAFDRDLWLVRANGTDARPLLASTHFSDEFPHWSSDGRYVLFARRLRRPGARWGLYLVRVDTGRVYGPVATPSAEPGYYGHDDWAAVTDWSRPA